MSVTFIIKELYKQAYFILYGNFKHFKTCHDRELISSLGFLTFCYIDVDDLTTRAAFCAEIISGTIWYSRPTEDGNFFYRCQIIIQFNQKCVLYKFLNYGEWNKFQTTNK